jgi:hypothetical protein
MHGYYHSIRSDLDPVFSRPPGPPLHMVQGRHAETTGRQRAIHSLHLPHVRLPTYDQARSQASHPRSLTNQLRSAQTVNRHSSLASRFKTPFHVLSVQFNSRLQAAQKDIQQGGRQVKTGSVPPWYAEDFSEPRTKLEVFFSSLSLVIPLLSVDRTKTLSLQ